MKGFPDLPPLWLVLFLVLNWAFELNWPGQLPFPRVSWVIIAAGVVFILWAAIWFRIKYTTIEPHHEPSALITGGPFRYSRNPIYIGLLIILAGAVIGRGQIVCLLLLPLFWWVLDRRFAQPEEAAIRRVFGEEGEEFISKVGRWI